ncbi:MAG: SprB repeat-containing protein [Bacteroidia bacterium]
MLRSETDVRCYGEDNGRIAVSATGGVFPYTWQLNGGSSGGDSLFAGLAPGDYTVRLTDANGCTRLAGPLSILQPDSLIVTLSGENILATADRMGAFRL